MTPYCRELLPLCEELAQAVFKIAGQAELKHTEHKLLDPKLLALALLCRTLGNFRGAVRMVELGWIVEARVLTRCCFENQLVIGGLYNHGVEFAEQIKADDVAGRKGRLKFITENESIFGALSEETREEMARAQESLQALAKASYLRFKEASALGPFNEIYLAYSQYSGDAAHPTFTALMRHFSFEEGAAIFDVEPPAHGQQLDETLHLACISLLSAAVAVNEMCGFTEAGKQLPILNARLHSIQAGRFGDRSWVIPS
ncbi:MAG: DUF5677 domain-containing protein [Xanthobacteraceae bacterium]|nr:DUF5677 domain-containing protein [Xanthobacteraceae bacterium]